MNRRFLLMVKKPTPRGFDTYDHILIVGEYGPDHDKYTDAQLRRKFRDKYRHVEANNPTRFIKMELVQSDRPVYVDTRTKVFSALFSSTNPDNNLLFLALSKEKLEADVLAHVRNFQSENKIPGMCHRPKAKDYEEACQVLCSVLGASLDESEHMLP